MVSSSKNKNIAGDKDGPKSTIENYKLDIMYDPIINVLDHWQHKEKVLNVVNVDEYNVL